MKKLLVGTTNPGKIAEIEEMLAGVNVSVVSLGDFPSLKEVEETGDTFAENARIKAVGYASLTGLPTLADDSGFEVEALGQRPGVFSARYGGKDAPSFPQKIEKLLAEMRSSGSSSRAARFKCAIAFASGDGSLYAETEGVVIGSVAENPRGEGGFGYDPIFIPQGSKRTFSEMTSSEKGQISHRGRALLQIIPYLRTFFADLT